MQPDDPELDVNTKPIWDITLKLGELLFPVRCVQIQCAAMYLTIPPCETAEDDVFDHGLNPMS